MQFLFEVKQKKKISLTFNKYIIVKLNINLITYG